MSQHRTGWVRGLLPFLRPHRRNVATAFGAALAGSAIAALTPAIERQVIDNVILRHRSPLLPWIVALVAAGLIRFGASYVRRFVGGRVSLDVQYDIRTGIYEQLQRLDFARHDEMHTGQLVSRANSDVGLIQGLLSFLPIMSGNLLLMVASLVIMTVYSPLLTVVSLVVVPALGVVAFRMRGKVFPATWDAQQKAGDVAGVVDEAVTGVRVVKGFGQEDQELRRLADSADALYGARMRAVRLQARYQPALQAIPTFGQVAILALGGWLALHHRITIGTFLAFSTYLLQMVSPARMLAGLLTIGQQARAGAERILDLLDSVPAVIERPDAEALPPLRGDVSFDGVGFGYLRSEPVLSGFDLHVGSGETVALVGSSGSGKSTVALLLPRFYDVQSGAVRVDGIDVRDVTLESLRRQIGVVFEESFLFSDTVRANIAYGRPDATEAEVERAARAAEAHDFVVELPDGYDTVVGERGLTLSGGQRQRIALARALITDPRILILDDATSAVDARTEEGIHATLRRVMAGRTTLLVAHRRSTLRLADRIVVVDGGRILDEGSHEDLLARCRLYRLLLAGPGDDVEGIDAGIPEDREMPPSAVTASAWVPPSNGDTTSVPAATGSGRAVLGGGLAAGRAGGGGQGGWMGALAPTPELLASVEALPPVKDSPGVDVAAESRHDPSFSLRRFIRPYHRPLAAGVVLVVLDAIATLAGPYLIRRGIDQGVVKGSTTALMAAAGTFLAVAVADLADSIAQVFVTGRTAERLLFALRVRIWAHLQRLSIDFYDREMAGRIMTRMTTDVDALANLLQNGLITAAVNLVTFAGVAVVLCVMNLRLALAILVVVVPLAWATAVFRRKSAHAYDRARERIAVVNADLQESLSGVRESQAFVRERRNERNFRKLSGEYLDARLDAQRLVALYFPFVEFLSEAADAIVLGVGYLLIRGHSLTPGELIAFLLYVDLFFSPIQQLSQVFDSYQQARASMRKIDELMRIDTLTPLPAAPVDPGRITGAIRLEGVRLAYPGVRAEAEALRGVDLEVTPGDTVALVGETGAGKSTVIKLVTRFYDPTAGRVLIDGVDLRTLDLGAYRRQLGYVPQEAFLFSGTIRDNIAYGRPDASDAEVERAARAVGAHEFVAGLTGGYLHIVNERGRSLSAGQRQLIALARAQLVDPAILLLDEATSNLDLGTEARVARAMGIVARGRTTLLIAHRLQTAMAADRIVVLDAGLVVEEGTHTELLDRGGRYAAMWRSFAEAGEVAGAASA
ncbi:MAG TPA: ABC transporter ATP-binding protein [Acidimicrobiales bacterium]|nr:ABC transporter ATP-binding protein [Acidimicrobiales bacterium]